MTRPLILDTFCEVYDLLEPYMTECFWDFNNHIPIKGGIYLFGRQQFKEHRDRIVNLVDKGIIHAILSNPHEGSDTLRGQATMLGIVGHIRDKKILLIGGGDMDDLWHCLRYDSFLPKLGDYDENIAAQARSDEIYTKLNKPYKFLFLNGRYRPHRKSLLKHLEPVLDQAIWSNLDSGNGEVKFLDTHYEFDFYQGRVNTTGTQGYVKPDLFNGDWGEVYIKPEPYIDTYFSLISETVFNYPYSFRTEKMWKPIVMGHPWMVHSNQYYYRDIQNIGFRTFGHLIDESFDTMEDNLERSKRIGDIVIDLCKQDLDSFVQAAAEVCKYNQQHYAEMRLQVRKEFPDRFFQFIKNYFQ